MPELTRQQRRAAVRKAVKPPIGKPTPTPYLQKLHRKLQKASLVQLVRHARRFTAARNRLARELQKWQQETENRIPANEWPDANLLIQVALCFSMVTECLNKRGVKTQFTENIAELNAIDAQLNRPTATPV